MRLALRRLRSVLSALKPMLSLAHHRWASEELEWLTHVLGPTGNWDIFAANLAAPVSDALSANRELEYLVRAVERRRHAVFDDAKQAILSERYAKSTLCLLRWFEAYGWREQPASEQAALLPARIS